MENLCKNVGMQYYKSVHTPIADENLIVTDVFQSCTEPDPTRFCLVVGSLLHVTNMTLPSIQYAVNRIRR